MTFPGTRTRLATVLAAATALLLTASASATATAALAEPVNGAGTGNETGTGTGNDDPDQTRVRRQADDQGRSHVRDQGRSRDRDQGREREAVAPSANAVVPGRYIVVYKPGRALRSNATATPGRLGIRALRTYSHAVHGFAADLTPAQLATLRADPAVDYVEPDRIVHATGTQTPADWGLDRLDQHSLPLNGSYTYPYDGVGVTAYVIDTGLRSTHTDFTGRVGAGINYATHTSTTNPSTAVDPADTSDCDGHGTHVAGTIGGTTYGVAKAVTVVPVRVLNCKGSGYTSDVIDGVDWVTGHHAANAVANMSLGGSRSAALDAAIQASITAGVTYAVSAGNDGANACNQSPADLPAAITVGASDSGDAAASYSNWGTCVDLYAPGSSIRSDYNSSDTATATMSGTSMAAPHVTGLAAQILQAHPGASPAQVTTYLLSYGVHGVLSDLMSGDPDILAHVPVSDGSPTITGIGRAIGGSYAMATVTTTGSSPVHGLSYLWTGTPTVDAADVDTLEDTTSTTVTTRLPDGRWYLHVRAMDDLGRWSAVADSGAFLIDVTAPRLTRLLVKPASPTRYVVTVGATDNLSGVGAVQLYWNHSRSAANGVFQVMRPGSVLGPGLSRGAWYLHVRVVDRRGRATGWRTVGPYGSPVPFVRGTVTQGARCAWSQRWSFGFTRTRVLERCTWAYTSPVLRWRPY